MVLQEPPYASQGRNHPITVLYLRNSLTVNMSRCINGEDALGRACSLQQATEAAMANGKPINEAEKERMEQGLNVAGRAVIVHYMNY